MNGKEIGRFEQTDKNAAMDVHCVSEGYGTKYRAKGENGN